MEQTSYIELSRSALQNNISLLRDMAGPKCQISHVVKGNAYGHGIEVFVPLAAELGARHFSTFDAYEAQKVCDCTEGKVKVMIMGMIADAQLEWAVENEVEFFVFEMDRLQAATRAARKVGRKAKVHIEFETGMNRTGFEQLCMEDLKKWLQNHRNELEICGYCTHYAGAENYANFIRVNRQYNNFMKRVQEFKKAGLESEILHTACSAASIRLPKTRMDLIRIGILQYGYWPNMETYIHTIQPKGNTESDPLQRVISWKSQVMSVKRVVQGDYIGYGTSYLAARDMKVAIVPVGYSHGFSRSLSNTGRVLIRGRRLSVVGIVNMNAMMVDVSSLENVEKGDEVVMIGQQGDLTISVSSFSEYSDQLNYELLTRLPREIPRVVVK